MAAATAEIAFNIYEGLVKSTPMVRLQELWPATGRLIRPKLSILLSAEAYFHNGKRVTADDVVNALNRAGSEIVSGRAVIKRLPGVRRRRRSGVIELSEPYAPLIYELTELAAAIYPRDAAGLDQPIGTGPYQLQEWRPNQYIKLTRFERAVRKNTYFRKCIFGLSRITTALLPACGPAVLI